MKQLDRRGFTLIEMLVALSVVALVMAIGLPRMQAMFGRSNVRSSRSAVITTLQQAKTAAINTGQVVTVHFDEGGDRVWADYTPAGGGPVVVGGVRQLGTQYGVAVRTLPASNATFRFDPRGLGMDADVSVLLQRGSFQDSVEIARFGRISK